MRWRPLGRELLSSTALALTASLVFAWIDAAPLRLSLAVLLFAGPVTDLLLELIRSRNPTAYEVQPAPRWLKWAFLAWIAVIAVGALAVEQCWHVRYRQAFAGLWLGVHGIGALNVLVAEWEDNKPGGFANPKKR